MKYLYCALLALSFSVQISASQKFIASDGSYSFTAENGWKSEPTNSPIKPLLDLGIDNAAGIMIARETSDEIRELPTVDVMKFKLGQFAARGMPVSEQTPQKKLMIGGMEAVEVEISSSTKDQNGILIRSRLILTVVRESATSILTSVASCRIGTQDVYSSQLHAILGSITKANK